MANDKGNHPSLVEIMPQRSFFANKILPRRWDYYTYELHRANVDNGICFDVI